MPRPAVLPRPRHALRDFFARWMLPTLLLVAHGGGPARAEDTARRRFDLPAGAAVVTLKRAAQQAGLEIVYSAAVVGSVQTQPVAGEFTPREALERMVANTPLRIFPDPQTGALSILRRQEPDPRSPLPPPPPKEPPRPMKPKSVITILSGWLTFILASSSVAFAADGSALPVGSIEGRVYNTTNGAYLNNARVLLQGSELETRTNNFGEFRFSQVPAGPVVARAVVVGFAPRSMAATVTAGMSVVLNIGLSLDRKKTRTDGEAVVLDSFVVAAQREMSGSAGGGGVSTGSSNTSKGGVFMLFMPF